MTDFAIHTPETAPEPADETLAGIEDELGFVPNLYAELADAPAALDGYRALDESFQSTSFDPVERQVVLLTVSYQNRCHYCMAAHTMLARMAEAPDAVVEALRDGTPIPDEKLEALRRFTRAVVEERGWVSDEAVEGFLEAGYTRANVLEVVLGVAQKTLSNYVNHLTGTPVDEAFSDGAWTPPAEREMERAGV